MADLIKKLVDGDIEDFRKKIFNTLYTKSGEALGIRKVEIANNLYTNTPEEQTEEGQE